VLGAHPTSADGAARTGEAEMMYERTRCAAALTASIFGMNSSDCPDSTADTSIAK
jgi:hypothetical protein